MTSTPGPRPSIVSYEELHTRLCSSKTVIADEENSPSRDPAAPLVTPCRPVRTLTQSCCSHTHSHTHTHTHTQLSLSLFPSPHTHTLTIFLTTHLDSNTPAHTHTLSLSHSLKEFVHYQLGKPAALEIIHGYYLGEGVRVCRYVCERESVCGVEGMCMRGYVCVFICE